ncbi:Protein of unknown function DUF4228 [Macleaya cordata]|uniref:Multidrug resistance protein ABC transporter family protein n=1 Tax=Macleaya cordata TaxID=56857 RepID=A0A200PWH9_MACCD|nr:Protein of unknown function DUF4228 [Macleaya cordata]
MGNYISHRFFIKPGKVILPDGTIHEFDQPLTVAELMLDHPQQVVVEIGSLEARKRPTPLPADKNLEIKKVYLMLPMKHGKAGSLSADDARRILLRSKRVQRFPAFLYAAKVLPLFAKMCHFGNCMGNEVVLHRKDSLVKEESEKSDDKQRIQLQVFNERPAFLSKEVSGKGWKPTLGTIDEKAGEKNAGEKAAPHWLFD